MNETFKGEDHMDMFHIALVVYWAFNGIGSVALIGKDREPVTPHTAVVMLLIYGLLTLATVLNGVG